MTRKKGTFVLLSGLKSEEGKKLNGAHGVILGMPVNQGNIQRYPVRIYAIQKENDNGGGGGSANMVGLDKSIDKKLKVQNLTADMGLAKLEIFDTTVTKYMQQILEDQLAGSSDFKKARDFWAEVCYNADPMNTKFATSHMFILAEKEQGIPKASKILWDIRDTIVTDLNDEDFKPGLLGSVAEIFGKAQEHWEQALEWVLAIPRDTPVHVAIFENAVNKLGVPISTILAKACLGTDPIIAQVNLKLHQVSVALAPDRVDRVYALAVAYYHNNNYLESARNYRRAYELLEKDPSQLYQPSDGRRPNNKPDVIKGNICWVQMQCPGMPLEDYHILQVEDTTNEATCIRREHLDRVALMNGPDGEPLVVQRSPHVKPDMLHWKIPADPDDESVFPALFLEQVRCTE